MKEEKITPPKRVLCEGGEELEVADGVKRRLAMWGELINLSDDESSVYLYGSQESLM